MKDENDLLTVLTGAKDVYLEYVALKVIVVLIIVCYTCWSIDVCDKERAEGQEKIKAMEIQEEKERQEKLKNEPPPVKPKYETLEERLKRRGDNPELQKIHAQMDAHERDMKEKKKQTEATKTDKDKRIEELESEIEELQQIISDHCPESEF